MWASLLLSNARAGRAGRWPRTDRGGATPMLLPAMFVTVVLLAAGCRLLPAPYLADASGPVRTVRVLDVQTGADIPAARVWVQTGLTNWPGTRQPHLLLLDPDAPDAKQLLEGRPIEPNPDASFAVSKRIIVGLVSLGYARRNPATATIAVWAPGYPVAALKYCASQPPWPGWSASRSLSQHRPVARDGYPATALESGEEIARCLCDEDGQMTFYLRRLTPELAAAIRNPGAVTVPLASAWSSEADQPADVLGAKHAAEYEGHIVNAENAARFNAKHVAGYDVSPWPADASFPAVDRPSHCPAGYPLER